MSPAEDAQAGEGGKAANSVSVGIAPGEFFMKMSDGSQ